ncbi:MAG TPA: 2,3-bisphosphoglycerate-dependent phosphoglycerate mutase [Candidatus Binatia bacterium]|jgi:2,3-bisphosphoglycerate-dependent phosphoglycerate mutase|nr:2,3-bisphosphoglycerate-dependent phosphoglycerate mutase [Candidatus Binatia bacterium]
MASLVLLRHGESQWNLENRFTGWVDVPLSPKGEEEARQAGEKLKAAGIHFDLAFTSVLQRAIRTLEITLSVLGQSDIPVEKDQALNERHYGDLQGLNKAETAKRFGDEQVHIWRRSYDVAPPGGESLKDTAARTLPYFEAKILPVVRSGKNVLVAAHGNSLRAVVMHLDRLSREEVLELNLGTGVPIVYEIDAEGRVRGKQIL